MIAVTQISSKLRVQPAMTIDPSVTDALSRTTTFNFDGAQRLTGARDPLGRVTTGNYDVLDRLTRTTDALGGTVQFTYDVNGNLLTHVDPNVKSGPDPIFLKSIQWKKPSRSPSSARAPSAAA